MTFSLVTESMGLGLALVFMIGPVFFALTQLSISDGPRAGIIMAAGISSADFLLVFVSLYGMSAFLQEHIIWVKYAGAIIFIATGLHSIVKGKKLTGTGIDKQKSRKRSHFLKGFLINFTNPFVIIFWIGTVGLITGKYSQKEESVSFFLIMLITVFMGDLIKIFLAGRLRKWITPKVMHYGNVLVGILLIIMGVRFMFFSPEVHLI